MMNISGKILNFSWRLNLSLVYSLMCPPKILARQHFLKVTKKKYPMYILIIKKLI